MRALLSVMMVACLAVSPAMAKKKNDKKDNKDKKEKPGPPKLNAKHSQGVDEKSGDMVHTVSVTASGASGMIFAIYKLPSGGRYVCNTRTIGSDPEKKGKKGKKAKKGGKKGKGKDGDAVTVKAKTFTFPHNEGENKFVDYVAVLYKNGKVLSKMSSSPMWLSSVEKLIENSASTFNSRGELAEDGEGDDTGSQGGLSDEAVRKGIQIRNAMETARRNQEIMDKMNNKSDD